MKSLFSRHPLADTVVVVSGLPRSGTSMMMKMLEAGGLPVLTDRIRTPDPDNPKGYYEFERVKKLPEGDTAWLPTARGKAVKIISALLQHLPAGYSYRVLFMHRAMPEVLASQRKMLIRRGQDPDQTDEKQLAELMRRHVQRVQAWLANQPHFQVLDVDYNAMLADPTPHVRAVNRFLGGFLDEDAMAGVVDPALYRNRLRDGSV